MSDYFSVYSENYKKYRPVYPKELFEYLCSLTPSHELAWDCGCGTGQATISLAEYYDKVVGTDISDKQIENAVKKENIIYRVSEKYESGLDEGSADLVISAQALHWFDLEKFHSEVQRVLGPGGIISVWTYNLFRVDKKIDALIYKFYFDIIYNYWPEERKHVENCYESLDFPFNRIPSPTFSIQAQWSLEQLTGYLNTWTGVKNYIELECFSPLEFIEQELSDVWGNSDEAKTIEWPLTVITGKI